jgi:hypothetical protein
MRTESRDMRRDLAAEAMAAENVIKPLAEQSHGGTADYVQSRKIPATAGLILAIALSLPFWIAIALLLRLLLR